MYFYYHMKVMHVFYSEKLLQFVTMWIHVTIWCHALCDIQKKCSLSVTCGRSVVFTPISSTNITDRHNWNFVEIDIKHHNPNPNLWSRDIMKHRKFYQSTCIKINLVLKKMIMDRKISYYSRTTKLFEYGVCCNVLFFFQCLLIIT